MAGRVNETVGSLRADVAVHRDRFELKVETILEAGTTTALLGPNGAGKSTLIDALAGLIPIDEGCISLADRTLDQPASGLFVPPEQRRLGVMFQRYHLFPHMTVLANVAFGPVAQGRPGRSAKAEAMSLLRSLHLEHLASVKPDQLSGGQAQQVAFARALAAQPQALLLDEPMAALDVSKRAATRRFLADHLQAVTGPRLLVTHHPVDAFLLADRVLILENGSITQAGTPQSIQRRPATAYAALLAGVNLFTGSLADGRVAVEPGGFELTVADRGGRGAVVVTVAPQAVSLYAEPPDGSPRNTWLTVIAEVDPGPDVCRVRLEGPLPLIVHVTPASARSLALRPGMEVWASLKATEVEVELS